MITLTVDGAVETMLSKLNQVTQIRDVSGKVIGYFAPADQSEALLYLQAAAHFDHLEMKQRRASRQQGYTTPEVLEHLDSLEKP